jgi:hypothetical protein
MSADDYIATRSVERWSPGLPQVRNLSGPMQAVGGLYAMKMDAVRFTFRRSFQWRELEQRRVPDRPSPVTAVQAAVSR